MRAGIGPMSLPKIYADFHNADAQGRLRLNCAGTLEDLARQNLELHEGQKLLLYADDVNAAGADDELRVEGTVSFSSDEQCWVAIIDWSAIFHASQASMPFVKGAGGVLPLPGSERVIAD
jgi:hypothetical protein